MKKLRSSLLILAVALCSTFSSCDTISNAVSNVTSFTNCQYHLGGVANPTVGGISLNNITDISQINALSLVKLVAAISQGSLPLSATVNVNATNPGQTQAQLKKLEWAIDLDNSEILQGIINQQITIPANGGTTTIPFTLQVDLLKLINNGSQNDLLNLALNIVNAGNADSKVGIRIKPTFSFAGKDISLGFISLSKSIKSS